jgi:FKBP-type peptidyl-prolyl cis-trans isomerase SlyD
VVLDGNHPLAGMSLRFDLRVTGVRGASAEEVERERESASAYADSPDVDDDWDDEPDGERDESTDDPQGDDGVREARRLH